MDKHVCWELIVIKIVLHLSCNYHNNPTKKSNLQKQINLNGVNDDTIFQHVKTMDW